MYAQLGRLVNEDRNSLGGATAEKGGLGIAIFGQAVTIMAMRCFLFSLSCPCIRQRAADYRRAKISKEQATGMVYQQPFDSS